MRKAITIIRENWKDPVWSKVISAGIIAILTFILISIYAVIKMIFLKVPFGESFNTIIMLVNKEFSIKLWVLALLIVFYALLVFNPAKGFFNDMLIKINKKFKETDDQFKHLQESSTSFFYRRMASAFPGERGVSWFYDPIDAINRLNILLRELLSFKLEKREFETDPIWWFRDTSSSHIEKFVKIGKRKILINYEQLKIRRIASYRGQSSYNAFVYVEVDGEIPTGLYEKTEEDIKRNIDYFGYSWEEYGLIKNWIGKKYLSGEKIMMTEQQF